jgi:hypothetical protein
VTEREQGLTTADLAHPDQSGTDAQGFDEQRAAGNVGPVDRTDVELEDAAPVTGDGAKARMGEPGPDDEPLLSSAEAEKYSNDWREVQGNFVDKPREAVEQADRLVADLMQRLAAQFSEMRSNLEQQWDGQEDISTEDLRVAMTRYRSSFERLLSA